MYKKEIEQALCNCEKIQLSYLKFLEYQTAQNNFTNSSGSCEKNFGTCSTLPVKPSYEDFLQTMNELKKIKKQLIDKNSYSFYTKTAKDDDKMSIMIMFKGENGAVIATDSRRTDTKNGQISYYDNQQKVYCSKDTGFGIIGPVSDDNFNFNEFYKEQLFSNANIFSIFAKSIDNNTAYDYLLSKTQDQINVLLLKTKVS